MGRGPTLKYHRQLAKGYVKGSLTCLSADTIRKRASIDFPLVLNIEPTNHCQLNCQFCAPRRCGNREQGFMDFDLYTKIIDECTEHEQLITINLVKDGEPLLHPRIYDMIDYAKEAKAAGRVHITTNGMAMTDLRILNADSITVSFDAVNSRPNLLSMSATNTLRVLLERAGKGLNLPDVRAKIMETGSNAAEVEAFVKFWGEVAQVTGTHDWSGSVDVNVTDEYPKDRRYPCVLPWYTMAVNWDGRVSACSLDWDLSLCVGTFPDSSIQEIWQGALMRQLRNCELAGQHRSLCHRCVVWGGAEDMTEWMRERKEFL